MRRLFVRAVFVLVFLLATVLAGIAARGRLPGYSWTQQYELYSLLIGAIIGLVAIVAAAALVLARLEHRRGRSGR